MILRGDWRYLIFSQPTYGLGTGIKMHTNRGLIFNDGGGNRNSLMLNTEFRTYLGLSKNRPGHLIGFWYLGQFTQNGAVPYLGLPAICWDMYNRAGRGYIQGSIRGDIF